MSKCYLLFAEGLEECEGLITLDILRRAGLETYTVSVQDAHTVVGAPGVPITCDRSHHAIILVALMGIVTLAVLVFVVLWLWLGQVEWVVFPCFVPAAVITYLVLNSVFFGGRGNLYVVLGLVASIFLAGYLVLLRFGMNFWQLFLILIPAEAVVYFSFHIRAKH